MGKKLRLKRRNSNRFKFISIMIVFIMFFLISIYYTLSKEVLDLNDEQIIKALINHDDNKLDFSKFNNEEFIFNYSFGFNSSSIATPNIESEPVTKEEVNDEAYIYIYNTHPTEKYSYESFEQFNIEPTVITASYILKEYLEDLSIYSYVEEKSVTDILHSSGWNYSYSYNASRILMEEAFNSNKNYRYFFDIHRDSASHNITTTEIGGESCARFLFIVGLENPNYEVNLSLTTRVNDKLNLIHENFTRGIMKKQGVGMNGLYNQDFHPNTILIEVGGQYNTIDEVNCSLTYLSEVIREIVGEDNGS